MKKSTLKQKNKIIVIVGPNASGKSELGIKIAKKYNGEIISADSRQVYRGLDVGSGKVEGRWKNKIFIYKNILHYCIGIANPKKVFTAEEFKKCAERAIIYILSRGKTPIIVGGTGFYIDTILGRIKLGGVPPDQKLRRKLSKYSTIKLFNYLKKLDPKRAKTVEQKNPRRLIRAIEIASNKKSSVSASLILVAPSKINTAKLVWIGIKRPPEELKKRIHKRLIERLPGIIREIKKLKRDGLSWKRLYDLGLEYRYVSLYLRGKLTKEEMISQLETATWHYAKRQMTWFKKNKEIKWFANDHTIKTILNKN